MESIDSKVTRQRAREQECYRTARKNMLESPVLVDNKAVTEVASQLLVDISGTVESWLYPKEWEENYGQAKRFGRVSSVLVHADACPRELAWLTLRVAIGNVKRTSLVSSVSEVVAPPLESGGYTRHTSVG